MHKSFTAGTDAEPDDLFEVVADLATYPEWLEVVSGAEPIERLPTDDGDAVWSVTLRARVGPLSRSKRLRMSRTVYRPGAGSSPDADGAAGGDDGGAAESDAGGDEGGREVRFERRETDGRRHSAWTMHAVVRPGDPAATADGDGPWTSQVELTLHYDGSMWSNLLDGLLDGAAETATERLRRYVAERV